MFVAVSSQTTGPPGSPFSVTSATHAATTEARGALCSFLSHRPADAADAVEACGPVVGDLWDAPAGQARHLTHCRLRLPRAS